MEQLEDLIRRCIENGMIEACLQEEEGLYSITEGEMTYWLEPDQVRRLLERLLREG